MSACHHSRQFLTHSAFPVFYIWWSRKKNKSTHTLRSLDLRGLLTNKKFHIHKVTAATSLPERTQNCALFLLLLNRSTVNSGYSREWTGWKHEAGWTLEKESVLRRQIPQQLYLHEHLHHLHPAAAPGNSARCTPYKPTTDSSTKTYPTTSSQVEMAAFMGNQNKFLQHNFSSPDISSTQQNPSYQLWMHPSSSVLPRKKLKAACLHLALEKAASKQEQHADLF